MATRARLITSESFASIPVIAALDKDEVDRPQEVGSNGEVVSDFVRYSGMPSR
jgi:hypothetical protein